MTDIMNIGYFLIHIYLQVSDKNIDTRT